MTASTQFSQDPFPTDKKTGFDIIKLANNKAIMNMVLVMNPVDFKKNPRGYQEKLFLNMTNYDAQGHQPTLYLRHAIDGPTFRMIGQIVLDNLFKQAVQDAEFGPDATQILKMDKTSTAYYQYREYKGGRDKKTGAIVSRVMTIAWNDTPGHKYPWSVTLTEGPGAETPTKAVKPAGTPTQKVQMQLSRAQMRQWMLLGIETLQSLTTVQLLRAPLA
ncbi:MAG: hypothetical protein M1318_06080 [Firmicutes bacterium]|jgi:hypothetical protein|nr:hypothetical protein [Bacillota bacterium]